MKHFMYLYLVFLNYKDNQYKESIKSFLKSIDVFLEINEIYTKNF